MKQWSKIFIPLFAPPAAPLPVGSYLHPDKLGWPHASLLIHLPFLILLLRKTEECISSSGASFMSKLGSISMRGGGVNPLQILPKTTKRGYTDDEILTGICCT